MNNREGVTNYVSLTEQLREAGHPELAQYYEEKNKQAMIAYMRQFDVVAYHTLSLLLAQLEAVTETTNETEKIFWQDLDIAIEEFLMAEKETDFPYVIEESLVTTYAQAIAGNSEAMMQVAKYYQNQELYEAAYDWYEIGMQLEVGEAYYWHGNYAFLGRVIEHDLKITYEAYLRASQLGYPDAVNNLADMYLRGEYVEQNDAKAAEIFKEAAKLGVKESMYTLGYLYHHGRGVPKDEEHSAYWYHQSALHGDVFAINKLGHEAFAEDNGERALSWYQKAADLQDPYGEYNVGFCYESGIGTPIDLKKAKMWYQRAALHGDEEAKKRLKELMKG